MRTLFLTAIGLVLVAPPLAAQHEHAAGDADELGQVVFSTTCSAEVQPAFNRAVAMLHSFWYRTSEQAFAAVAEEDPGCAMAYWGVAMSRFRQLWEQPGPEDVRVARAALREARAAATGSERERGYIAAIEEFYGASETVDPLRRKVAYAEAMEALNERYRDDTEAAIFYALSLLGTAYSSPPDKTYARQKKAGAMLESMFAAQPTHPGLAHYIIHSYDYPELAERALEAARRYAEIAPDAPHALHMPSHIFTRLGLWQESIASNRSASAAAHKDRWIGEELHTTDYLAYAYLQGAQDGEAERVLSELPRLKEQLRKGDSNHAAGVYAMTVIPARYAVERRQWSEAAALAVPTDQYHQGGWCWATGTLHLARGLGAAHTGDLEVARESIERLERCREVLLAPKGGPGDPADGGDVNKQLWASRLEVQRRAAAAWLALAEGREEEALQLIRSAAELEDTTDKPPMTPGSVVPARELLGEMLLALGRPDDARREFEVGLLATPNRFRSLYGAARAAELTGDLRGAGGYYAQLLEVCRLADTERAEIREAKRFLAAAE